MMNEANKTNSEITLDSISIELPKPKPRKPGTLPRTGKNNLHFRLYFR